MNDDKPKHKPQKKHTLSEVLKSLQDLIRTDLITAQGTAPPTSDEQQRGLPPAASTEPESFHEALDKLDDIITHKIIEPVERARDEPLEPLLPDEILELEWEDAALPTSAASTEEAIELEALEPTESPPPPPADEEIIELQPLETSIATDTAPPSEHTEEVVELTVVELEAAPVADAPPLAETREAVEPKIEAAAPLTSNDALETTAESGQRRSTDTIRDLGMAAEPVPETIILDVVAPKTIELPARSEQSQTPDQTADATPQAAFDFTQPPSRIVRAPREAPIIKPTPIEAAPPVTTSHPPAEEPPSFPQTETLTQEEVPTQSIDYAVDYVAAKPGTMRLDGNAAEPTVLGKQKLAERAPAPMKRHEPKVAPKTPDTKASAPRPPKPPAQSATAPSEAAAPSTDQVKEPIKPKTAHKAAETKSPPESKAPPTAQEIPVLQEVAVLDATPAPALPDVKQAREIAIRVIAKLNIERRKSGEAPLDIKTIERLQQYLADALLKRSLNKPK